MRKSRGKCVKVCTRHIDIPAKLEEAKKELEGPGTRALFFVARPGMNAFTKVSRWKNLRKARS